MPEIVTIDKLRQYLPISLLYKLLLCLCLTGLLLNIRIGSLYISFACSFVFAISGFFLSLIEKPYISKLRLIVLVSPFILFFFSLTVFVLGYNWMIPTFTGNWLKQFVIFYIGVFSYIAYKDKHIDLDWFKYTFVLYTVLFCGRFLLENFSSISTIDSGGGRPNPEWAGGYNQFASILAIASIMVVSTKTLFKREFLRWPILGLFILCIVLTMSRGGLYSCILGLGVYYFFNGFKKFLFFIFAFFMLGLGSFAFEKQIPIVQSAIDRFVDSVTSKNVIENTSGRSDMWFYTFEELYFRDAINSLVGHGVGTYRYDSYYDPHNTYFHLFWEYGLVGFLFAVGFTLYLFINNFALKIYNKDVYMIITILIVLCFNMLVEGYQYSTQTGWLMGVILGISFAIKGFKASSSEIV